MICNIIASLAEMNLRDVSFNDDSIRLGEKSESFICYWKLVGATPFKVSMK